MSTTTDSDNHPPREPPNKLKPTTLPHGIVIPDAGAGGEGIGPYNGNINNNNNKPFLHSTPTPSATDLARTFSQSSSQTQLNQENTGGYVAVLHISLRISFYLAVASLALFLTLAACKFTNLWDPCETLYINTTECKVTSYLKGMVYHTDCTEEYYCVLPGFQSNVKRQEWSFHKPNETAQVMMSNNNATAEQLEE